MSENLDIDGGRLVSNGDGTWSLFAEGRNEPATLSNEEAMRLALTTMGAEQVPMTLPSDALRRLREVWESGDDDLLRLHATALIRDLFGGIDGHLTAIDAVLPR